MSTHKQIEANRRNAQNSTGPKTEEGKARASRNAISHGVFAEDLVLNQLGESEDDLLALRSRLTDFYQPAGMEEEDLVEDMLALRWRLKRIRRAETGRLNLSSKLQLIQSTQWRSNAGELLKPQEGENEREALSRLLGTAVIAEAKDVAALSVYEARLQKMLERAQDRLNKLQRERLAGKAIQREVDSLSAGGGLPPRKGQNEANLTAPKPQLLEKQPPPATTPDAGPAPLHKPPASEPSESSAREDANR